MPVERYSSRILPILLTFKFAYKWAVSKKLVTGFAQIFVCEIKIYLFGSYLRFKSVYRHLSKTSD
jgi:hypothetical protein